MADKHLTTLERAFADRFTGNANETEAQLRKDGYNISRGYGRIILNRGHVVDYITSRHKAYNDFYTAMGINPMDLDDCTTETGVLTKIGRQAFWSSVTLDETVSLRDRLKASELLGRSECDFSEARIIQERVNNTRFEVVTGIHRSPNEEVLENVD